MKKLISIAVLCVSLSMVLTGCPNPSVYINHPVRQPETYWISKDESVCFYVEKDNNDIAYGIMQTSNETLQVTFKFALYCGGVGVHNNNGVFLNLENSETITKTEILSEIWSCSDIDNDKFHISILESAYFKNDSDMILYKTDKKDIPKEIKKHLNNHPQRREK